MSWISGKLSGNVGNSNVSYGTVALLVFVSILSIMLFNIVEATIKKVV